MFIFSFRIPPLHRTSSKNRQWSVRSIHHDKTNFQHSLKTAFAQRGLMEIALMNRYPRPENIFIPPKI